MAAFVISPMGTELIWHACQRKMIEVTRKVEYFIIKVEGHGISKALNDEKEGIV